MRTDKIRKYVLPNIPYLFIGWACLKMGMAYRLAAGANFGEKLLGLMQTIGMAFADFSPGLDPFDWLIGIVGAVAFRLLIYFKSKNAKKYRRDEEYGSSRWGCPKDIQPFVDSKFENNVILTGTELLTMNTRPKIPANARNLNACIIGSSGSGKTRFWLTPQLLQAHSSYVVVDPKGGVLGQVGYFLQKKRGYKIKVFNSIDFSKSMHYNPLAYIKNEADILKFVNALISNTKGEGKEGDPFWTKAETLLYCALIAYIIFEGPAEDRNMNTLVDMISGMEVKEDDDDFMNAVDYMFAGLEKRKPDCFAVKQYKKYKLSSGVVCSKRLLNQAVGKSLRTHNLKPKKGAQVMRKNEKITALYERLSRDDFGKDDDQQRESNSISNQELLCRGWFLPPNTYDCGSFVVNGTAVVGKEPKHLITAKNQHKKELILMKSLFEEMGGTYRQEGDYLIPNLALPDEPEYQIGKYGRMRRSYLKEHRPILYTNLLTSGTLHRHLAEIDQACNERMAIIVSDMARQEDVTEALKAADQMEWVRRMNNIHSRAEEIVLTELVYE